MIKDDYTITKKKSPASVIKTYHFLPNKYGRELLIDISRIESLKNFVLDNTPHNISFYEILFIEKGKGSFSLDENKMTIEPGTIVFTSPGQIRRWDLKQPASGYTLFFEKDFLNLFFTDDLFLYRFQYFHQYSRPSKIKMPAGIFNNTLGLVRSMESEFSQLQKDSSHLLRAILYQLLVVLNRYYAHVYQVQSDTHIQPDFFRFRSLDISNKYYLPAKTKGITLHTDLFKEVQPVFADISLIERVVQNLIDNALKFTPAGGQISIQTSKGRKGIQVSVHDTGIGIASTEQQFVFERYYKGYHTNKYQNNTGLGLAIAKKILDLHDASLVLQSQLNKGSVFAFELPLYQ